MNELDLDSYNLTMDDFMKSTHRSKSQVIRGVDMKGHPKVQKLNLDEIIDVRDQEEVYCVEKPKFDSEDSDGSQDEI